jgi:hypothetical protein
MRAPAVTTAAPALGKLIYHMRGTLKKFATWARQPLVNYRKN